MQCYPEIFEGGAYDRLDRYFVEDYREHNPFIPDGIAAARSHQQSVGGYRCRVQEWLEDGEIVYARTLYRLAGVGYEVVDIYRLDRSGRATEHWDTVARCDLPDDWDTRPVLVAQPEAGSELTRPDVMALYDGPLRRRDPSGVGALLHPRYSSSAGERFGSLAQRTGQDWEVDEVRHVGVRGDRAFVFYRAHSGKRSCWVADVLTYLEGLVLESTTVAGHCRDI